MYGTVRSSIVGRTIGAAAVVVADAVLLLVLLLLFRTVIFLIFLRVYCIVHYVPVIVQ